MQGNQSARNAIVVGAGMAGLMAARVLADYFTRVHVLERDHLPAQGTPRPGVPQGKHFHALLSGGVDALEQLFPGFGADLEQAGAVRFIAGLDVRTERPGPRDAMPQRDLGMHTYSLSRPLLEHCVLARVRALPNVTFEEGVSVRQLLADGGADDGAVHGVELAGGGTRSADLVVDASGRGELTCEVLSRLGYPLPRVDSVGVDVRYATAIFAIPDGPPRGWKAVMTFPDPRISARGALMAEMEGGQWMCGLGGRADDAPPADPEKFLEFARGLRTPTIYEAIKNATMVVPPERFGFAESQQRHFEELERFVHGLLPVGDSICRFNPIYGQGMSVAAIELVALKALLDAGTDVHALAAPFFTKAAEVISGPWRMSVIPDFVFPQTRGERPPNLEQMLRFSSLLNELAARDIAVHRLLHAVASLVSPSSVLGDPALVGQVLALEQQLRGENR